MGRGEQQQSLRHFPIHLSSPSSLPYSTSIAVAEPIVLIFDQVAVLMNNAAIGVKGTSWGGYDQWKQAFDVNLFGYVDPLAVWTQARRSTVSSTSSTLS